MCGSFGRVVWKLADGEDCAGGVDDGRGATASGKLLDSGEIFPTQFFNACPGEIEIGDAIVNCPGSDRHCFRLRPQSGDPACLAVALDGKGCLISTLDLVAEELSVERRRAVEIAR